MLTAALAHQGGWDEILLVAAPLLILVAIMRVAKKRADRLIPLVEPGAEPSSEPDGEPAAPIADDGVVDVNPDVPPTRPAP